MSRVPSLRWLLVVGLLAVVAACAPRTEIRQTQTLGPVLPLEFELVEGRTSIERFDPPGAGDQLELTAGAQLLNPNEFGVRVDAITYTMFLEGRRVARGALAPDVYLEPGGTAPVRFDVVAPVAGDAELLTAAVRAFADRPMRFHIEGTVRFRTSTHEYETRSRTLVQGTLTARQSVEAPVLRMLESESRVFMVQPGVPVIQLVLQAVNPGDVGYFLLGKDLVLSLSGWRMATEDMRPVPLAANQATRIDMLFYPVVSQLPEEAETALQAALLGHTTLLTLEGELFMDVLGVDSFPVPQGWTVTGFVHGNRVGR